MSRENVARGAHGIKEGLVEADEALDIVEVDRVLVEASVEHAAEVNVEVDFFFLVGKGKLQVLGELADVFERGFRIDVFHIALQQAARLRLGCRTRHAVLSVRHGRIGDGAVEEL